jgi:transcriptional regulator with XRE-family HTH domain
MLQQKLGRRIASLRKSRGLTQVQLARQVGCTTDFISLVERGVNVPSVAGLEKFFKGLGVWGVSDLFASGRRGQKHSLHSVAGRSRAA